MGFRTGSYAKIWSIEEQGNRLNAKISISRKNKETGGYEQTFGGYVRVYGDAVSVFKNCGEGGRVKLGDIDVTNRYNAEKKVTNTYYHVYTAETVEARSADFIAVPDDLPDDGLPFN